MDEVKTVGCYMKHGQSKMDMPSSTKSELD